MLTGNLELLRTSDDGTNPAEREVRSLMHFLRDQAKANIGKPPEPTSLT